jgi:group I intron endonuclease
MTSVIYVLCAIDGKGPRYVGHTAHPGTRLTHHRKEIKRTHKCHWVQSIGPENIEMAILEIVPTKDAPAVEKVYIQHMRAWGFDLVNGTDGGEGASGYKHTPQTKLRLSALMQGHKRCVGRKMSEATRRKIGEANTGNTFRKGKMHSAATRAKMSKNRTGKRLGVPNSPEHSRHISEALKGHAVSDETRRKISEAHKRRAQQSQP